MQQWEYYSVHLAGVGWENKGWRVWQVNDQEQPNWKKNGVYPSVTDFCSEMGQLGWELICAAYPGETVTYVILHFKRHIL